MIALFLVIAIVSFSLTIFTDEAWSLRELDYDRDGILDEFDECLTVPETYNKFEDTDGCPDSLVPSVSVSSQDSSLTDYQCREDKIPVLRIYYMFQEL